MADGERHTWTARVQQVDEGGKSTGLKLDVDGKTRWVRLDIKFTPPQVGDVISAKLKESIFRDKTYYWIQNWERVANGSGGESKSNGHASGSKDTFPSVQEQFVKEVISGWAKSGGWDGNFGTLKGAVEIARMAWDEGMAVDGKGDQYTDHNPPPPDDLDDEIPF